MTENDYCLLYDIASKRITELEKENTELKEKYADLEKKYFNNITDCDWCDTYCNSQLIKAKEIIRSLYFIIQGRIDYTNNIPLNDEMYRANQFLKQE